MDPKTFSQLDPKLQETYARVMGTPTNPSATAPSAEEKPLDQADAPNTTASPSIFSAPPAPVETQPSTEASSSIPAATISPADMPSTPPTAPIEQPQQNEMLSSPSPTPVTPSPYTQTETQPTPAVSPSQPFAQPLPSPAEVNQAETQKEVSPLLRVLYIIGAVIFFAIYTIFWIKVFNLPFLF